MEVFSVQIFLLSTRRSRQVQSPLRPIAYQIPSRLHLVWTVLRCLIRKIRTFLISAWLVSPLRNPLSSASSLIEPSEVSFSGFIFYYYLEAPRASSGRRWQSTIATLATIMTRGFPIPGRSPCSIYQVLLMELFSSRWTWRLYQPKWWAVVFLTNRK